MTSTIREALRDMRQLRDTHAGRLSGYSLRHRTLPRLPISSLPGEWGERLAALLDAQTQGQVTGDTPAYIVCSDGMPVAWLTAHAAVIAPDVELSRNQANHQRRSVEALSDLARHVLEQLADERDQRSPRHPPARPPALRARRRRVPPPAPPTVGR